MRDVDGDHRDPRLVVGGGNRRGDRFVGLELDHQVDAFADQQLRVLEGDPRLVAVVDDDQLDLRALGGADQALADFVGERAVLPLAGVADPVFLAPADLAGEPIAVVLDLLDEAAVAQRVEQPEAHALGEPGAVHDVAQAQRLPRLLERPQHLRSVHQRFHEIELVDGAPAGLGDGSGGMAGVLYTKTYDVRQALSTGSPTAGESGRPDGAEAPLPRGSSAGKLVKPLEFSYRNCGHASRAPWRRAAPDATVRPHKHARLRNR